MTEEPLALYEARRALASLCERPELDTPDAIAGGPYGLDQLNGPAIEKGLGELARRFFAHCDMNDGTWSATSTGADCFKTHSKEWYIYPKEMP